MGNNVGNGTEVEQSLKGKGGAPKGNLNALRYPWKAYVRRGALRVKDRWALKVADDFYDRVLGTKGSLNGMQQLVAENGQVSRVAIALIFQGHRSARMDT